MRYAEMFDLRHTHGAYTLVRPVEPEGTDLELIAALERVLDRALRAPSGIQLVRFMGAHAKSSAGAKVDDAPWVTRGPLKGNPFRLLRRPGLLLDVRDATVDKARACAKRDPLLAATMLARQLLLEHEALEDGPDEDLTAHALGAVLGVDT